MRYLEQNLNIFKFTFPATTQTTTTTTAPFQKYGVSLCPATTTTTTATTAPSKNMVVACVTTKCEAVAMDLAKTHLARPDSAQLHNNYLQFEQIHFVVYTNTLEIWTNTIYNLDKYEAVANGHRRSIHTSGAPTLRPIKKTKKLTNNFCNLDKYI